MKERIKLEVNWDEFFDGLFYFILKLMLLGLGLTILLVMFIVLISILFL